LVDAPMNILVFADSSLLLMLLHSYLNYMDQVIK